MFLSDHFETAFIAIEHFCSILWGLLIVLPSGAEQHMITYSTVLSVSAAYVSLQPEGLLRVSMSTQIKLWLQAESWRDKCVTQLK